ncbi:protein-disulfide reductase DsbD family protein [Methylobacterium sp. CB376]|uniref:protein-disulfide reductase DsbD domain-containing protein n=1 Tax=Methylobacterium sp. CB376 TaxID=3138063 RepID=UPI0024B248A6|nr:protein-disulfide reductase DsbD domain-containing protein [Methylobacterium nodulans]WFT79700.1 protein-disulfide reductase DsbD family protein [Methylobacterium nodulans]
MILCASGTHRASGRRRAARPAALAACAALTVLALVQAAGPARAASAWATGLHARARLIPGGQADGVRFAGLEILLDRGFKTFWRDPGEAGMPPAIDWSSSRNAAAVDVLWPVPRRMKEAGDVVFGYEDRVVLPIRVVPADGRAPVSLRLRLDYGVCNDICIPVRADLSLTLPADAAAVGDPRVAEAVAASPRPVRLGEGPLAVLGAVPEPPGLAGRLFVAVRARVPSGDKADLFVSAPPAGCCCRRPAPCPKRPVRCCSASPSWSVRPRAPTSCPSA